MGVRVRSPPAVPRVGLLVSRALVRPPVGQGVRVTVRPPRWEKHSRAKDSGSRGFESLQVQGWACSAVVAHLIGTIAKPLETVYTPASGGSWSPREALRFLARPTRSLWFGPRPFTRASTIFAATVDASGDGAPRAPLPRVRTLHQMTERALRCRKAGREHTVFDGVGIPTAHGHFSPSLPIGTERLS